MEDDTLLYGLCRICGVKTELECSKYIFDEAVNLAQIINETLPIKVSQNDHSKYICLNCYNKVVNHYNFIKKVLAYSKENETKINSFFEINKNEKLESVVISKLHSDMIHTCPNCNIDLMILIKKDLEDCNSAFQISLAIVDQIEKSTEENIQISEDTTEFVDVSMLKSNTEDELTLNYDIDNDNTTNNNERDNNENDSNLPISQKDTNYINSYITCQKINELHEPNKGTKRKFQESVSTKPSVNRTKLQKLEAGLDVMGENTDEISTDYYRLNGADLIIVQPENNGMDNLGTEIEIEEENSIGHTMEKKFLDKNPESQKLGTILDAMEQKDESSTDYDRSSVTGLIALQPENDSMEYLENSEIKIKEDDSISDMAKIKRKHINEDDTNDNDIYMPKGNIKLICDLCGARYISQEKYEFHMERHKLNKIDRYVCIICDKKTTTENLLWEHYVHVHKSPMQYICSDCDRVFPKRANLNNHQRRHKHSGYKKIPITEDMDNNQTEVIIMKRKRKCTVCRKLIKDIDSDAINDLAMCASCEDSSACLMVDGEVAKTVSQRQYHCSKCRKNFMRRERLEFHNMRHNENMDEFICSTCGREFSGENSLYEHYLFVHKGARPHICEVCGKTFQLKARLKEHHRKHTGEKPYQCEICGLRCMTSHALKFHKKSHLSNRHTCDICGKAFIKKQNLNEHLEKHWKKDKNVSLPKIFTCPLCNTDLPTYRMLKGHMIGIHDLDRQNSLILEQKPLHECNECHEKFRHQMSLKAHKEKVHEGKINHRIFQCDTCKVEYRIKQMLINHITNKHGGEKQYKCAQCNMRFADTKTLYQHILQHTGRKPFICEYCNMNFRRKSDRDTHRRKHTDERPYQCSDCNMSFDSYINRSSHRKKVHGDNETECPECGEKCGDMQEIRIHLNKHLGEKLSKLETA